MIPWYLLCKVQKILGYNHILQIAKSLEEKNVPKILIGQDFMQHDSWGEGIWKSKLFEIFFLLTGSSPTQGIELVSPGSPALQVVILPAEAIGEALFPYSFIYLFIYLLYLRLKCLCERESECICVTCAQDPSYFITGQIYNPGSLNNC